MPLFLSLYVFSVLGFIIHYSFIDSKERTRFRLVELFLLYQIIFSLGMTSFMAFFGLTFLSEYIADITNWPWSPFEQQLGNVNLAFGVLGTLSIWFRGGFWMATILGFSVWILSDGFQHLYHAFFRNNLSEGNIGVPLYTDFIIPIILLIALYEYVRLYPKTYSRVTLDNI